MENSILGAYAEEMTAYLPRTVDSELARALRTSGAVLVRGPRACGKTETARQASASELRLDQAGAATTMAAMDPASALDGPTPRLLDEWQAVPDLWNAVRHAVDDRRQRGQFILTGSATPVDDATHHSGAGRIRSVTMRTMTLPERGLQAGHVSLTALLRDEAEPGPGTDASVADYASWMVSGGWPGWLDLEPGDAQDAVRSYVQEMSEHDYPEVGGARRDPHRFHAFLAAYAGLIAQPASLAAVARRMETGAGAPSPALVPRLHDFAGRLFLVEDQPAWSPRLRSRTSLVQAPKRHLADPSLALALLGAGTDRVLADPETLGVVFESQVVHDLRVAAQAARTRGVFHLRDSKGRDEIDAVVEASDGAWLGVEVKLSHRAVDAAAANLLRVAAKVERPPAALAVIIPTGPVIRRPDGVWVLPLVALHP